MTAPKCDCGSPLTFRVDSVGCCRCQCLRCKKRSERGDDDAGHVADVIGSGNDEASALASWCSARDAL